MVKAYKNEIVSVIIPVYNSSRYIAATIESVLNQTYDNIEIILVDDCSTDNSAEIIKNYTNKYKNIVYHLQDKNNGAAVARNKGLDLAKGRYIAFLDSDDLWYPKKIEKQLKLMKLKNISFCYTSYEMIDSNGELIKDKIKIIKKVYYKDLLKRTVITTSTVMLDRKEINNLKMPNRRTGQDYAFWLLLLRKIEAAYGIDEVLVKYRNHEDSLSKNKLQNIIDVWEVQTHHENIFHLKVLYNLGWYIFNAFLKRFI